MRSLSFHGNSSSISRATDIDDFLAEEIKGPGKMVCDGDGHNCVFDEPAMNSLINDVFGDSAITLDCQSGECMHYSMVPGFTVRHIVVLLGYLVLRRSQRPSAPDNSRLVALSIAAAGLVFFTASLRASARLPRPLSLTGRQSSGTSVAHLNTSTPTASSNSPKTTTTPSQSRSLLNSLLPTSPTRSTADKSSPASRDHSNPAKSWRSWAHRVPASRRCSTFSRASRNEAMSSRMSESMAKSSPMLSTSDSSALSIKRTRLWAR